MTCGTMFPMSVYSGKILLQVTISSIFLLFLYAFCQTIEQVYKNCKAIPKRCASVNISFYEKDFALVYIHRISENQFYGVEVGIYFTRQTSRLFSLDRVGSGVLPSILKDVLY